MFQLREETCQIFKLQHECLITGSDTPGSSPVSLVVVHDVESHGHMAVAVVTAEVVHPLAWQQTNKQ